MPLVENPFGTEESETIKSLRKRSCRLLPNHPLSLLKVLKLWLRAIFCGTPSYLQLHNRVSYYCIQQLQLLMLYSILCKLQSVFASIQPEIQRTNELEPAFLRRHVTMAILLGLVFCTINCLCMYSVLGYALNFVNRDIFSFVMNSYLCMLVVLFLPSLV